MLDFLRRSKISWLIGVEYIISWLKIQNQSNGVFELDKVIGLELVQIIASDGLCRLLELFEINELLERIEVIGILGSS